MQRRHETGSTSETLRFRVAYVGPQGAGKYTSLWYVCQAFGIAEPPEPQVMDLDGVVVTLGAKIRGFTIELWLWPTIGSVFYGPARRAVFAGPSAAAPLDGVVYVADAEPKRGEHNKILFEQVGSELAACGYDPRTLPSVIQVNKCDLADPESRGAALRAVGLPGLPTFESVASDAQGVIEPLKALLKLMMTRAAR